MGVFLCHRMRFYVSFDLYDWSTSILRALSFRHSSEFVSFNFLFYSFLFYFFFFLRHCAIYTKGGCFYRLKWTSKQYSNNAPGKWSIRNGTENFFPILLTILDLKGQVWLLVIDSCLPCVSSNMTVMVSLFLFRFCPFGWIFFVLDDSSVFLTFFFCLGTWEFSISYSLLFGMLASQHDSLWPFDTGNSRPSLLSFNDHVVTTSSKRRMVGNDNAHGFFNNLNSNCTIHV